MTTFIDKEAMRHLENAVEAAIDANWDGKRFRDEAAWLWQEILRQQGQDAAKELAAP